MTASRLRPADVTVTHEPPDGWWIDLPAGWIIPGDCHGIVEDTKAAALRRLRDAVPCDCDDCRQRLAR